METENNFSPQSKVWIYQSTRAFDEQEIKWLNEQLSIFAKQWTAHNAQLKAIGKVVEDRIILLMVDETQASASGCSIDSSVHFIKSLEKTLEVNLFDRSLFNYILDDKIYSASLNQLEELVDSGVINQNTIVYDPLVKTKSDFDAQFKLPISNSWMKSFAGF